MNYRIWVKLILTDVLFQLFYVLAVNKFLGLGFILSCSIDDNLRCIYCAKRIDLQITNRQKEECGNLHGLVLCPQAEMVKNKTKKRRHPLVAKEVQIGEKAQ